MNSRKRNEVTIQAIRLFLVVGMIFLAQSYASGQNPPGSPIDFAHEVVPILRKQCASCHSGDQKKGGFSFNTREALLTGSESGSIVEPGHSQTSRLLELIQASDANDRMPPEGDRLAPKDVAIIQSWIDQGLPWERGFAFSKAAYEPPLAPRKPELPPAIDGRENPIDRWIDRYLSQRKLPRPQQVGDEVFLRRVSLDLVGLLPTPENRREFLAIPSLQRRSSWIESLLARDIDYAEHWLSFWNDLLRNDYGGTGFITGGRKQVSTWLYESLLENKPFDRFASELIAPPAENSRGFIEGIKWRGEVSAGQTNEIQFAQSVAQTFLGINLKCASCHDSFVDRWKLDEAYGLAAVYSTRPLEIHRCDKPIGRTAKAAWLFPELGEIDSNADQPERLRQLAKLMTHPGNGRFSRTIVNRLWHRMMGRGLVHPTDAMQTEPWESDLLDFLASDFVEHGYNLKHTLHLIASSQTYQSQSERLNKDSEFAEYQFAGHRAKRMSAEQWLDSVWQITGAAPKKIDAPFLRGKPSRADAQSLSLGGKWIWSSSGDPLPAAGERRTFRKTLVLDGVPTSAGIAIACDNQFTLYVNGKKLASGSDWNKPEAVALTNLKAGENEILIVAENQGNSPNPAGLFVEARLSVNEAALTLSSDSTWEWTESIPNDKGKFGKKTESWAPAALVQSQATWAAVDSDLRIALTRAANTSKAMSRASLLKANALMRSLGRPNRDQIVSMRPSELTTLEAIDLTNGEYVANLLTEGSKKLQVALGKDPQSMVAWLYRFSFGRDPSAEENSLALESLGTQPSELAIQDLLWAIIVHPEFQLIR